jgi:hypothetical protein
LKREARVQEDQLPLPDSSEFSTRLQSQVT